MICVVQRVQEAHVEVGGQTVGAIEHGMVVLAAIEKGDTDAQISWTAEKLAGLRIFRSSDGAKHFDQDIRQVDGAMLLISNFTIAAETRKGRRPSLDAAADPAMGEKRFAEFISRVKSLGVMACHFGSRPALIGGVLLLWGLRPRG